MIDAGQDQGNRLMKLEVKQGAQLLRSIAYTYDPNGNILTAAESDGSATSHGYTDMDQLLSANRTGTPAFSQSFTYDPNGNRQTMIKDGIPWTFNYNAANWLTQIVEPGYGFSWENDGNLLLEDQPTDYTYTYDGAENLNSLDVSGGPEPDFIYASDGDGRRVAKTNNVTSESFGYRYSLLGLTLEQRNGADHARYVRLPNGSPLAVSNSTGVYYYLQDASDNVRGLLNSSGLAVVPLQGVPLQREKKIDFSQARNVI